MNKLTIVRSVGVTLRRFGLGLGVFVGLVSGMGRAATATATYDLGAIGSGTVLAGGETVPWIAQGILPAGSILREVSIAARLDDSPGGTWASDLNVVAGGLLQIGSDGGSPDWANGQDSAVGVMVIDTKFATLDFPDTIDLNTTGLSLKNTWSDATWSGTVTVTYDLADPAALLSFGLPGHPSQTVGTVVTWRLPVATDVTALAPTFTLAAGATCDHVSGTAYDFSAPVHYVVTSADTLTIKDYTVTVVLIDPSGVIHVNLDTEARTGLDGPAGGAGEIWNQQLGTAGLLANNLTDSTGASTSVGFTLNASNAGSWGDPALKLLTGGAFQWDWSTPSDLVIGGLTPGKRYIVYLASFHPNELGGRTLFSTTNPTTTEGVQIVDNAGPDGNSAIWVQGVNYARIDGIEPDSANRITITLTGDSGTNEKRAYLSGFQLMEDPTVPPDPYTAWLAGFDFSGFTDPDLTPAGDPDGDGISNGDEFATGLNPAIPSGAGLGNFGIPQHPANINGTSVTWRLPFGTDVTALAPTFALSTGAACDHVSGTAYDFSAPAHYVVTSADGLVIRDYTVTIIRDVQLGWINVNIDTESRSGLVGPAGGAGTTWNELLGTSGLTAGDLLDANGKATGVGVTCDASDVGTWGTPDLSMLTGAAFSFGSESVNLVISGLKPGMKYALYLASYHPYELGGRSVFSTANATTSAGTLISDTGGPDGRSYRWFRGVNYVRFDNIVPDSDNRITITMVADSGTSAKRAYLSGFQLVENPAAPTNPYAMWLAGFDFSSFTDPDLALDGDPDGDMRSNIEEFELSTQPTVAERRPGVFMVDFWNGVSGSTVADLLASAKFFREADTVTFRPVSALRFSGAYIGTRSRGYITPAVSGDYTFWLSARTSADLWLSSDLTKGKYAKQRIAAMGSDLGQGVGIGWDEVNLWDRFAGQQSAPVHLEAGQAYYMEIDHKTGSAADSSVCIAWARDGSAREVLPDAVVSSYVVTTDDRGDNFLPNAWELQYGLNPADNGAIDPIRQGERADFDGDGIINRIEYLLGTNPADSDTDRDGESDGDEVNALGTNALVANAITDTLLGQIALAGYTGSSTVWTMTSGGLIADSFRGDVTWNFTVPSDGFWLLRLNAELMGSTFGNEEVPVVVSVDGMMVLRRDVRFGMSRFGTLQALTPWLASGTHQVTILVDNMLARRTVRLVSLKIYAPANSAGLLARANRVLAHPGTTRTSPAFIEGYARDAGGVTVNGVPAAEGTGNGHWYANVPLAPRDGSQPYTVHFEQGSETSGAVAWQATNVMDGEALTVRQGDSLLVGAWSADPGMTSAGITSTSGGPWHLTGRQAFALPFPDAGTFVISATVQNGAGGTMGHPSNPMASKHSVSATLTVKVVAAPDFPLGIIDALDNSNRTLTLAAAPEVALESPLDLCRLLVTRDGTDGVNVAMLPRQPVGFGIAARLFADGPILAVQQINVIGVSDALQNDMTSVAASGIVGYKIYNSPLTVTNLPEGGRVDVTIFRAGVMFLDGSMQKSVYPADLTNGWVNLQFLFPVGASGGYCHGLDVYDRNGDYIGSR